MAITAALPHGQDMSAVTKRKPKPKPRKASGPTLEQRVACIDRFLVEQNDWITSMDSWAKQTTDLLKDARARIDALESRDRLRDKSHDEPVSNASEAIGQSFRIVGEIRTPWWRRFLGFMGSP